MIESSLYLDVLKLKFILRKQICCNCESSDPTTIKIQASRDPIDANTVW